MFLENTVSECTDVPQKVILPAKEIAYHKHKILRTRQVVRDQDLSWVDLSSIVQLLR